MRDTSILGGGTVPDDSGNVFPSEQVFGAQPAPDAWRFVDAAADGVLKGYFFVPDTFISTAKLQIPWQAFATVGLVQWQFEYEAVANLEDLGNTGSVDETVTVAGDASTAGGSLFRQDEILALTDLNFVPNDYVRWELTRLASGDTMADFARLLDLRFSWSTT